MFQLISATNLFPVNILKLYFYQIMPRENNSTRLCDSLLTCIIMHVELYGFFCIHITHAFRKNEWLKRKLYMNTLLKTTE